ncbi:MAG: helix-turn-helix transcriptional regulator [Lachnospiraceae bacterium]|nr:helix-turn-helix transcriptional regulator [Lachnospiraceae bacterium]
MKDYRFSALRRKDRDTLKKADITTEELADILGISTGTISKLENDCQEGEVPSTTAIVLKKYRDYFNCSYEYLMGETNLESRQYDNIATSLPFKMLQSQDIKNLAYIFSDPKYGHVYASLLSALLSKPDELKELLSSLLPSLRDIAHIHETPGINKTSKNLEIRPVRYTYTNIFAEKIEEHFIPRMKKVFAEYDSIKALEHQETKQLLNTTNLDTSVLSTGEYEASLPPQTPTVEVSKMTLISTEDSPK